jgi:hypothetical protein
MVKWALGLVRAGGGFRGAETNTIPATLPGNRFQPVNPGQPWSTLIANQCLMPIT